MIHIHSMTYFWHTNLKDKSVFNRVSVHSVLGFVSANEMAHEHPAWRNISLKNGDGAGSETRSSLMVRVHKLLRGANLWGKTKRSFVPILFTSRAKRPINMASFQIVRSNSSNYLYKPWWVGISCIHGCTFVRGLVHCTGRACWGRRSRKNNHL